MRMLALAGLVAIVACGGSNGGNNNNNNGTPGLKTFSYGSPQAPTTAQQNTANTAQTQLNNAVKASVNGQIANAASLPSLTDSLAGSLPNNLVALPGDPELTVAGAAESVLGHRSGALSTNCYSVTTSSITYSNCSITGSGFSETLNGNLTVGGGVVTWNLTVTYNYSASNVTSNGTYNWSGQLTVATGTIVGLGRSTFTGHVVSGSTTYDYTYTAGFDSNLTYQSTPSYCLSGGTLEVRRTLNATSNAGAVPVHDAGARYNWTSCGSVTVARGT